MLCTAWYGSGLFSPSSGLEPGCLRSAESCVVSWLSLCQRSWLRSLGCSCLERSHISSPRPSTRGKGRSAPGSSGNSSLAAACQVGVPGGCLCGGGRGRARRGGKPQPVSLLMCRAGHRLGSAQALLGREITLQRGWSRKATTSLFRKPWEGSSVPGCDPAPCVRAAQAGVTLPFQPGDSRSYLS